MHKARYEVAVVVAMVLDQGLRKKLIEMRASRWRRNSVGDNKDEPQMTPQAPWKMLLRLHSSQEWSKFTHFRLIGQPMHGNRKAPADPEADSVTEPGRALRQSEGI